MGVRQRRRTAIGIYRPGNMYFWAGMLICLSFGLTAAGVFESWKAEQWWWLGVMVAGELGLFVLYVEVVRCWLLWMNLSSDYTPVDDTVEWWHEQDRHNHHQGEH